MWKSLTCWRIGSKSKSLKIVELFCHNKIQWSFTCPQCHKTGCQIPPPTLKYHKHGSKCIRHEGKGNTFYSIGHKKHLWLNFGETKMVISSPSAQPKVGQLPHSYVYSTRGNSRDRKRLSSPSSRNQLCCEFEKECWGFFYQRHVVVIVRFLLHIQVHWLSVLVDNEVIRQEFMSRVQ